MVFKCAKLCVCINIYMCVCACIYIYVCVCMCIYICVCGCECASMCMWGWVRVCVCVCVCCEIGKQYISKHIFITLFQYWTNDVLTVHFLPLMMTTL